MIAVIDNYDSFTFNLVQYLGELGAEVRVYRNDTQTVADIAADKPKRLLISPGPCTPDKAGISLEAVEYFKDRVPILGVCLGHQTIGQYFGGKIVTAEQIMHGKLSSIQHNGRGVFAGLPDGFTATRYHSLVIENESLPDCLERTAWVDSGDSNTTENNASNNANENDGNQALAGRRQIMGFRHKTLNIEGVQFHPESISSEFGHELLQNFLQNPQAVL